MWSLRSPFELEVVVGFRVDFDILHTILYAILIKT